MKYWPVPNSYSKIIPQCGSPGSFWENRGDRYHCGIDIYAPNGSEVISIDDGIVLDLGIFTSPNKVPYWHQTKYILIENKNGIICKYAELGEIAVKINEEIKASHPIGYIGTVLNINKITDESPKYIRKIKSEMKPSMLHFEMYSSMPNKDKRYLGGNWFGNSKPKNLLNPANYL